MYDRGKLRKEPGKDEINECKSFLKSKSKYKYL
jgi:hypothetical protein